jgi:hypothetical protein
LEGAIQTPAGRKPPPPFIPGSRRAVKLFPRARRGTSLLRYAPDGKLLAAGTPDGVVQLWDAATRRRLGLSRARDCRLASLAFLPGRRVLAAGLTGAAVSVWELPAGRDLTPRDAHTDEVNAVAFGRDGKAVISVGAEGARVWGPATGRCSRHIPLPRTDLCLLEGAKNQPVTVLAFSPDGRTVAAGTSTPSAEGDPVVLWELASGKVRAEFRGHRGAVTALAFAPDGRTLATGGADTTVLLWDLTGGIDAAARPPGKLSGERLDGLWSDLGSSDARKAYRAMTRLAAAPAEAVALLRERVKPDARKPLGAREVERLIAELEGDSFAVREQARRALEEAGRSVRPALLKALEAKPGAEKKRRLRQLLEGMPADTGPVPALVRPLRAVELLERLGTPEARRLLEALARGQPGARLTAEARAALRRLSRQP